MNELLPKFSKVKVVVVKVCFLVFVYNCKMCYAGQKNPQTNNILWEKKIANVLLKANRQTHEQVMCLRTQTNK